MTSAFRIGTKMIMLGTGPNQGKVIATGTPRKCGNPHGEVQQFINGSPMVRSIAALEGTMSNVLLGHPGHARSSYSA